MTRPLVAVLILSQVSALRTSFLPPAQRSALLHQIQPLPLTYQRLNPWTRTFAGEGDIESPSNLDRLREEAANPFRSIRIFVYGAAGFNAGLGGLTACTQLIGAVGNAPNALPVDQVLMNIAVNFGVVGVSFALWRFDSANREESIKEIQQQNLDAKEMKEQSVIGAAERESMLPSLKLMLYQDEASASVDDLQVNARQHIVILAGKRGMISDSLLAAQILGEKFRRQNILVVPVLLEESKGFDKPRFDTNRPFVATPETGSEAGWKAYVGAELEEAKVQGASIEQGIVIARRKDGKVVRRGLGVPIWESLIDSFAEK